jgi:hypothetical protein
MNDLIVIYVDGVTVEAPESCLFVPHFACRSERSEEPLRNEVETLRSAQGVIEDDET